MVGIIPYFGLDCALDAFLEVFSRKGALVWGVSFSLFGEGWEKGAGFSDSPKILEVQTLPLGIQIRPRRL